MRDPAAAQEEFVCGCGEYPECISPTLCGPGFQRVRTELMRAQAEARRAWEIVRKECARAYAAERELQKLREEGTG